ncbi:MAG: glycosyltransferase, partial [Pseudomonadota bacterium]
MPTVLWWGRGDPDYSRNRVVLSLFADLGWRVESFRPVSSPLGGWQARFAGLARPDLVWVPCFRQTDLSPAAVFAKKWGVPLVADPLISAFQKEVAERGKHPPGSPAAEKRRRWESSALAKAEVVVCDTPAHARYFEQNLGVDPRRTAVLFVGAEEGLFTHRPLEGT